MTQQGWVGWSQRSTRGVHGGDLERRAGVSEGGVTAEQKQTGFFCLEVRAWCCLRGLHSKSAGEQGSPLSRDQWRQELQWRQDEASRATKGSTLTSLDDLPGLLSLETSAPSPPKPFGSRALFLAVPRSRHTLKPASTS